MTSLTHVLLGEDGDIKTLGLGILFNPLHILLRVTSPLFLDCDLVLVACVQTSRISFVLPPVTKEIGDVRTQATLVPEFGSIMAFSSRAEVTQSSLSQHFSETSTSQNILPCVIKCYVQSLNYGLIFQLISRTEATMISFHHSFFSFSL